MVAYILIAILAAVGGVALGVTGLWKYELEYGWNIGLFGCACGIYGSLMQCSDDLAAVEWVTCVVLCSAIGFWQFVYVMYYCDKGGQAR